ncbi:TLC domain-containing protein [Fimicolochytrium jonesii]|uniref:TLC domain-containing protein n=1 Tax=Fimicolochytrium jonesii TaxID=1396493 RepID=UPI0022FEF39C|nr:TLC domain-containing protein [Fimicolochytrium jonesii]KAI8823641.1 TLC domain-containing protein [Fimicolochytrium jonesii]
MGGPLLCSPEVRLRAHTTNGSPELSAAVPVECIKPVGGSASAVRQRKPNGKPGSNSAMKRKPSEVNGRPTSPSRPRRVDDREKFTLSAWKFFMFGISTLVGIYLYRKEGWLLDPKAYWENWGQPGMMSDLVKFYYKLGFSAYAFHSISIFFEPKQKDFAVMVTHHVITLLLIYLSYVWPYFRVGAAILFLHDMSDPFMELAKMALYTGRTKLADYLFGVFAMVFIITRNYIFPVYVIGSIFKYGGEGDHAILYGDFTVRDAATVCLCLLEVLHIFWSSLIVKMAYKALTTGAVGDDTRNDD